MIKLLPYCTPLFLLTSLVQASVFSGDNTNYKANWDSDDYPGWNGTGVPNSQGAVAEFPVRATVTQNVSGGVTIGTLAYTGTSANQTLSLSAASGVTPVLIFDQDGDGPGYACISNATKRRISMGSGNYQLNDDLLIISTHESPAQDTACISLSGALLGSGNLTLDNSLDDPSRNPIVLSGSSKFTGAVLLRRGCVKLQNTGLGASANIVTIGAEDQGDVSLFFDGSGTTLANPVVIASGTGGETVIGSYIASNTKKTWTHTLSGAMTLQGDIVFSVPEEFFTWAGTLVCKGVISGVGSITKRDTGTVTFAKANTYAGGTAVSAGCLAVASSGSLGSGPVSVAAGATLSLSNSVAIADSADITLGAESDAYGVLDLPAGVHESVGTLHLGSSWKFKGTYGATGSGAKYIDDHHFTGGGVLEVLSGPPVGTVLVVF